MTSGNRSAVGIGTSVSLRLVAGRIGALPCGAGIEPVTSAAAAAGARGPAPGMGSAAAGVPGFGAGAISDCRAIGVGDVIEGSAGGSAALVGVSAGGAGGEASPEISAGICGAGPESSSVIAILKVPSTITTTLAPTSSERIFEVMVDDPLAASPAGLLSGAARLVLLSLAGWAAAACAARRAAAIKLDVLACSRVPGEISLMALSEAAMRSDGEAARPIGRVPGSSG